MTYSDFQSIVPGDVLKHKHSDKSIEVIPRSNWVNIGRHTVIACNGVAHFTVNICDANDYETVGTNGKKTICTH